MRRRHLLALPLTCLILMLLGCPQLAPPDPAPVIPSELDMPPVVEVEADTAYLAVADAFFSAIAEGKPASAYGLLTDGAHGFLTEDQFVSGMSELSIDSHNVAAHATDGDVAYVVASLESVEAVAPEAMVASAYGLLLRNVDDDWRVSFFLPQSADSVAFLDLTLTPGEVEGQYTISWVDSDDEERYMAVTEF